MQKRILVAPLNWGLGHATRCIPIIKALSECGFTPVIASDGVALALLRKEFPEVESIELPSYQIKYAKKGKFFKLKMIMDSDKLIKAINKEHKKLKEIVKTHRIDGVISDNRMGLYHKKLPCVFITHQLRVLSGNTTWISTKLHQAFIKKFDACWVPDTEGKPNLTGKLGHLKKTKLPLKYIGALSRLEKRDLPQIYEYMILLSGPEPQRTMLDELLTAQLENVGEKVLFVRGFIEEEQKTEQKGNVLFYNFMNSEQLEEAFNQSGFVVSRSGYTTVMDLAKLEKKAFFIPTPGQFEQEYLAEKLDENGIVPYCKQDKFSLEKLQKIENYTGLQNLSVPVDFRELFRLFEGK
ncbi:MAG: glycosyltransferase [Capnocytophaga sp.]|nr:glycosyltransferase [Capnocytophaga sp.]